MSVPKHKLPQPLYRIEKKIRNHGLTPAQVDWMEYLIPGSNGTMRNLLGGKREPYGIADSNRLGRLEERFAAIAMIELQQQPVHGSFDFEHMSAIHQHLFHNVYAWAGQRRTVNMFKNNHGYAPVASIAELWDRQRASLVQENFLRNVTDQHQFSERLAEHWGMINYAHAFREGNTRSQVMFFEQLAHEAGWELDVTRFSDKHPRSIKAEFVDARFHHQSRGFDHRPLARVLHQLITPAPQPVLVPTTNKVIAQLSPDYGSGPNTGHGTNFDY